MTDQLKPYGDLTNTRIVAKIGHAKTKYGGRIVEGKEILRVERLTD